MKFKNSAVFLVFLCSALYSLQSLCADEIVITAKGPHPMSNCAVTKVVKKHLGKLPEGILTEKHTLETKVNVGELLGDTDPLEEKLLSELNRLYPLVKMYDKRTLLPMPSSTQEESCMISSALGSLVFSVDLSGDIGKRTWRKPGRTGVFLRPLKKGEAVILKLIIGIDTPKQRLSPLLPLLERLKKIRKKVKFQSPMAPVELAEVKSGDLIVPAGVKATLNYYVPRPENGHYPHFAATLGPIPLGRLKATSIWHLRIFRRGSKGDPKDVLKSFVFYSKDIASLAEFNYWLKNSCIKK